MSAAAIVLLDNTIAGCIMADAALHAVPPGYPSGARLVNAPSGCNETWAFDGHAFTEPPPALEVIHNKVEF